MNYIYLIFFAIASQINIYGMDIAESSTSFKHYSDKEIRSLDSIIRKSNSLQDINGMLNDTIIDMLDKMTPKFTVFSKYTLLQLIIKEKIIKLSNNNITDLLITACSNKYDNIIKAIVRSKIIALDKSLEYINFDFSPQTLAIIKILVNAGANTDGLLIYLQKKLESYISKNKGSHFLDRKIKVMLDFGLDINCRYDAGNTPLILAALYKNIDAMECLLRHKANPDDLNIDNETAIFIAIRNLDRAAVELLIKYNTDINVKNLLGQNSLNVAIQTKKPDIIELLIQKTDLADKELLYKNNLLSIAIEETSSLQMVEMLINMGADVNYKKYALSKTPLRFAIEHNSLSLIRLLIEKDVDVNLYSLDMTPLEFAIDNKSELQIITMLIKAGANDKLEDYLIKAVEGNDLTTTAILIENGALEQCQNNKENGPLLIAVSNNNLDIVATLLIYNNNNVDINCKGLDGSTPLLIAVNNNNIDIVDFLLSYNADINCQNNNGDTPLIRAVLNTNIDMVTKLLKTEGIKTDIKNNQGFTALDIASQPNAVHIEWWFWKPKYLPFIKIEPKNKNLIMENIAKLLS